jgi:hypothetical protein
LRLSWHPDTIDGDLVNRSLPKLAALAVAPIALAAPAAAHADVVHIDGSPLEVFVDGLGGLQVRFDGQPDGEFCCSADTPDGTGLALRDSETYSEPSDDGRTPVTAATVTTTGTTHVASSSYDVDLTDNTVRVSETVTCVDGTRDVKLHFGLHNLADTAVAFDAGELADLYAAGSDGGAGFLDGTAPQRFLGGIDAAGGKTGLVEVTRWTHYQEGDPEGIFDNFRSGQLADTFAALRQDDAAGAQWHVSLGADTSTSIRSSARRSTSRSSAARC